MDEGVHRAAGTQSELLHLDWFEQSRGTYRELLIFIEIIYLIFQTHTLYSLYNRKTFFNTININVDFIYFFSEGTQNVVELGT